MVAKIDVPSENSTEVFNNVFSNRTTFKTFYKNIGDDWKTQIAFYIENKGDPTKISPLNIEYYTNSKEEASKRKKSLINLYKPDKKDDLYRILDEMRNDNDLLLCPTCGDAGEPDTLDHYLPKDIFPELSILLLNLTPMCSKCQRVKGTKYLSADGDKKFIHPYYDEIDKPIYYVNFKAPYGTPRFELRIYSDLEKGLKKLAYEHAKGIKLKTRINKFCRKKYIHLMKSAKKCRTQDKNNLKRLLSNRLEQEEEEKAINCWEAIFYRSVLADVDLLDYLLNKELPKSFK